MIFWNIFSRRPHRLLQFAYFCQKVTAWITEQNNTMQANIRVTYNLLDVCNIFIVERKHNFVCLVKPVQNMAQDHYMFFLLHLRQTCCTPFNTQVLSGAQQISCCENSHQNVHKSVQYQQCSKVKVQTINSKRIVIISKYHRMISCKNFLDICSKYLKCYRNIVN